MNVKSPVEVKETLAPMGDTPAAPAAVALEEDWLAGVTPQASCNLDGTCESCQ
jgi:hypothetical protein